MTTIESLIARLRNGDGNGCKAASRLMLEAADALEDVLRDSYTGQAEHARWQARAERLEQAIRDALAFEAMLPAIATNPRQMLVNALGEK